MLTTCPIHDEPVAGPKQLQLKARAEGVGVGATGVGAVTSDGTLALGMGAASWAGALGGGTGASKGFGAWQLRPYASAIRRPADRHDKTRPDRHGGGTFQNSKRHVTSGLAGHYITRP